MATPQLIQINKSPECTKQCELHTLTASQLGGLISLLAGLAFFVVKTIQSVGEKAFEQQYFIVFFATAIYYFMEEWVSEEQFAQELRELRSHLNIVEFWLRVLEVITLGFIAFLPRWFSQLLGYDLTDAGLFLMACLYELFLWWDFVVYMGGGNIEKLAPFWGDFFGFILTVGLLYNRHFRHGSNVLWIILLILVVAHQMSRSGGVWATLTRIPVLERLRLRAR